jgi:hypothetical protein
MKNIFLSFCVIILTASVNAQWSQVGEDILGQGNHEYLGASLCINASGDIVVIGHHENENFKGKSINQSYPLPVRVFYDSLGIWKQIGQDISSDTYGPMSVNNVSINGEGSRIVIGNYLYSSANHSKFGSVRVYENILGTWEQIGDTLFGSDNYQKLGQKVSINQLGNIVAVTTMNGANIYEYVNNNWEQIGQNISINEDISSIDINSEGDIVAIAGYDEVRVFQNIDGSWEQIGMTIIEGHQVALNALGNIIAVGDEMHNGFGEIPGRIMVYEYLDSNWTQLGNTIEGESWSMFGKSVDLDSTGYMLVGGGTSYQSGKGIVKVYQLFDDTWVEDGNSLLGDASGENFGIDVSISSTGNRIIVGSHLADDYAMRAGKAKIFGRNTTHIENLNNKFKVYPNPSSNLVNIDLEISAKYAITLFNSAGKCIRKEELYGNSLQVDIADLTPSIYWAHISSKQFNYRFKIIKL